MTNSLRIDDLQQGLYRNNYMTFEDDKHSSVRKYLSNINSCSTEELISKIKDNTQLKIEVLNQLKKAPLHSEEANVLQAQLYLLNQTEDSYLYELKSIYTDNSKQARAIETMLEINQLSSHKNEIMSLTAEMNKLTNTLKESLSFDNFDEATVQDLSSKIDDVAKANLEFSVFSQHINKEIYREKAKLKRNILSASEEDRKMLAALRSEYLSCRTIEYENNLKLISSEIDFIQKKLKDSHLDYFIHQKLQAKVDSLKKAFFEERKDLKVDKTEKMFWLSVQRMPAVAWADKQY